MSRTVSSVLTCFPCLGLTPASRLGLVVRTEVSSSSAQPVPRAGSSAQGRLQCPGQAPVPSQCPGQLRAGSSAWGCSQCLGVSVVLGAGSGARSRCPVGVRAQPMRMSSWAGPLLMHYNTLMLQPDCTARQAQCCHGLHGFGQPATSASESRQAFCVYVGSLSSAASCVWQLHRLPCILRIASTKKRGLPALYHHQSLSLAPQIPPAACTSEGSLVSAAS